MTGRDFEDTLARAANHDGDSDSTASIAGQLYGAWKELSVIPHRLVWRLDVFDDIVGLVRQIAALPLRAAPMATERDNPTFRQQLGWCLNVLEMVHELHCRGYQRLRICPGLSASGGYHAWGSDFPIFLSCQKSKKAKSDPLAYSWVSYFFNRCPKPAPQAPLPAH